MTVRPFDFRDIAALDDTAVALRTWISKSTSFFSDYWVEATGFSAKLAMGTVTTEAYEKVLGEIPRHDLCCVAEIKDRLSSVFYSSAKDFRTVMADLLCLSGEEDKEEPELSAIEIDLANYFIDRVGQAIRQGWMGTGELEIEVTELEKDARKLRLFRGKDLVTKVCLDVECKSGNAKLYWLLPKQELPGLLDDTIDQRSEGEPANPSPELVGRLPLEVVTLLGSADVPMSKLIELQPGELIMLDQRIDSPMISLVDGVRTFECWPGRLGAKQAIQVENCLNQ